SAIVVYDEQGDRVLETALNYYSTEAVLELQEGYRVDYVTRQGEITLMPFDEEYDTVFPAGLHTVGTHLEAGLYTLLTKELPVRRENSEDNIYFNADRKSTRLNSSHVSISYAVFCLKKKKLRYASTQD